MLNAFAFAAMITIIYVLTNMSGVNILVLAYMSGDTMAEQLLESVRSKYAAVAESTLSNNDAGVQAVAEALIVVSYACQNTQENSDEKGQ